MARIKRFLPEGAGGSRRHPTVVECGYAVVHAEGEKLLQLNTYGSEKRAIPGKMSQTLQLDREQAHQLAKVIAETFEGKRDDRGRVMLAPPDMRRYLESLAGGTIETLTGAENKVLRIEGDDVIVGTDRSPQGQPVPLHEVQAAADQLFEEGCVDINPSSVGYRSAFIGAVLASLPGTLPETQPRRILRSARA